jgi:hypothetical protein
VAKLKFKTVTSTVAGAVGDAFGELDVEQMLQHRRAEREKDRVNRKAAVREYEKQAEENV